MAINKLGSPFNWEYVDSDKLPECFYNLNVKEDFVLLFDENNDINKLKEILRATIREPNQVVRKFLWKRILSTLSEANFLQTTKSYDDKRDAMFGKSLHIKAELPHFVDKQHLLYYYLNDNGKQAVIRILNAIASAHPDITYAPLLLPLTSLFLHYMNESETYACILFVIESNNKITQTDIHWTTNCYVFRRLASKYCSSAYEYLISALSKQNAEKSLKVIDEWTWWLFEYLPFNYILNIVDSYLLEGQKVLYRYGIILLDLFTKSFQRKPSQLDLNCINNWCRTIQIPLKKINKLAYSLRNMSKKQLQDLFDTEENHIKHIRAKMVNQEMIASRILSESSLNHSKTIEDMKKLNNSTLNKSESANKLLNLINPFRSKAKQWELNQNLGNLHRHQHTQNLTNVPPFSVEHTGTHILEPSELVEIWRWLPTRLQLLEFETVYSTDIHGCRLMTLFDKIEFYDNSIIIIKTTKNQVFGAFCSQPWSNRLPRPKFFGTGETFLFKLRPEAAKYEWIGRHIQASGGETSINQELFLYADNKILIVGGSGGLDGNGLQIDENLQFGSTNKCNTFLNDPLCETCNFEIAILEVLSFKAI